MRSFVLLFILLYSASNHIWAQDIKIRIKAPEIVMEGEQFKVTYIVESKKEVKEAVIIKNMENFRIIYGPSVSSSNAITFNGGKRQETYRTISAYYLEAVKKGVFILPKAEFQYEGKKYKSDVCKIEVKSPEEGAKDIDAFVKTIVSKSSVNLTDTLMFTYRLYSTKEISQIVTVNYPAMDAFFVGNMTQMRQKFAEEEIDGKKYQVVELRKLVLQPKDIGRVTIPGGTVVVEYAIPTGRKVRDIWGDIYEETIKHQKTLPIEPVIITIQDLKEI